MVISDSMFKHCTAKDTKWSCYKGHKIKEIMDRVRFDPKVTLQGNFYTSWYKQFGGFGL